MRYVYLPDNLTAMQLLDFRECSSIYQSMFQEDVIRTMRSRQYLESLAALDIILGDGQQTQSDQQTRALSLVLKAEIYRRQGRWDEAITQIRYALNVLEFQYSAVAKYNEAVAVYTEGLCQMCMQSQRKVADTFSFAQSALKRSERYWHVAKIPQREYECNDVVRFMGDLQDANRSVEQGTPAVFMPVYEIRDNQFIRTDAIALQPLHYSLRLELTSTIASDIALLNPEGISLITLSYSATYVAMRVSETGDTAQIEKLGDILILEVLPEDNSSYTESKANKVNKFARTLNFTKTHDGRVIYNAQALRLPGCEWLVSPHLLIRKALL